MCVHGVHGEAIGSTQKKVGLQYSGQVSKRLLISATSKPSSRKAPFFSGLGLQAKDPKHTTSNP